MIPGESQSRLSEESEWGERRHSERYRHGANATVRKLDAGNIMPGVVVDLCTGGCSIRLNSPPNIPVGTSVDISVTSKAVTFRALGTVRHSCVEQRLVGVSFGNISRSGQADLCDLIAELDAKLHPNHLPK
jgi:hypothetical protein